MTGFSADWLRLRAPFDRAARDAALARRFAAALPRAPGRPLRLLDLGAGTGANARALAPLIPGDQDWRLDDDDGALLSWQAAETLAWAAREGYGTARDAGAVVIQAGPARWRFSGRPLDLARELDACLDDPCDGISMAALADLTSARWVDALAACLRRRRVPLLSALAVAGKRLWLPAAPEDDTVRDAFAAHQRRDKGFGPALGSAAPLYLAAALAAAGFVVATGASDWRIGPEQGPMLAVLIDGEAAAAVEARPALAATVAGWAARRQAELAAGGLSLVIGHRDLLALPREI